MAWLFKFTDSNNWFVGYRLHGRQVSATTGTPDKEEAKKQLHRVEAMLASHADGDAVDNLYRALKGGATGNRWTLKAEADSWISEATKTAAPSTATRYRIIADGLLRFLNATDEKPLLSAVGTAQVSGYLDHVSDKKSVATANFERKALRVFFRRAIANRRLEVDPMLPIKPFKATAADRRRRPFTAAEVSRLFA
ncbi:MAG: hypothetical protein KIT22_20340, partial [Verrucomicrobiae bacterium]|nr:hypothetical protein [Verrucomicrobiae bacterium]